MRLEGRTALVTGAGSGGGLGRAIALRFAAEGAGVAVADLNRAGADAVAAEIAAAGGSARAFTVDVADQDSVAAMAAAALDALGTVQILVNCAGIGEQTGFLEQQPEEFERLIGVNLTGSYRTTKALAPAMVANAYGRIVNIASVAGLLGVSGRVGYGASKTGVVGLTRHLAIELAPHNITVNALAPGPVDTPLTAKVHSATTRAAYLRNIPAGRYGKPEEIAAAALFLASDEAAYITGHTLPVDGGFSNSAAIFEVG